VATARVETLLAELEAQAGGERAKLVEEARQKTEQARSRADAEIRGIEEAAARQLERAVALDRERIHGRFQIEERRRLLEARRAALTRVFAAARQRMGQRLAGSGYARALERRAAEALQAVGGEVNLEVARRDAAAVRQAAARLPAGAGIVERGDEPGTVVAVSRDGSRRADNSVAARMAQAERHLEDEVARRLFGAPA
jgi:vacuolar-type H+-ATPase subunit E/Vma4